MNPSLRMVELQPHVHAALQRNVDVFGRAGSTSPAERAAAPPLTVGAQALPLWSIQLDRLKESQGWLVKDVAEDTGVLHHQLWSAGSPSGFVRTLATAAPTRPEQLFQSPIAARIGRVLDQLRATGRTGVVRVLESPPHGLMAVWLTFGVAQEKVIVVAQAPLLRLPEMEPMDGVIFVARLKDRPYPSGLRFDGSSGSSRLKIPRLP